MNYGNYGRDLLLELHRSEETTDLPVYNDTAVTACLQDLKLHVNALQDQVSAAQAMSNNDNGEKKKSPREIRPSILLQDAAIRRNKRCLLTYHWVRIQRLQQAYFWRVDQKAANSSVLATTEKEFLEEYESLQADYLDQAFASFDAPPLDDLRAHATVPPVNSDRVLVRVMDFDESEPIVLASGQSVSFVNGETLFIKWSDVEQFVRQGKLQLLQGEEHSSSK